MVLYLPLSEFVNTDGTIQHKRNNKGKDLIFDMIHHEEYRLNVHFTRDSWNGRMKACRGVGASLKEEELKSWESEHIKMLSKIAPEEFDIKHYAALAELEVRK